LQDREDLRPKSNLVAVKQEAAATQIQSIAIETQSLCLRLRASVSILTGHCPAINRWSTPLQYK